MPALPLISVIIPVFNASKFLRRCLDSVLLQTYSNVEMILINDGSTDDSIAIIEEYLSAHNTIKCVTIENSGVSVARNYGIVLSKGEYIFFLDSDDWLESTCLEILYASLKENNVNISACNYYDCNGNLRKPHYCVASGPKKTEDIMDPFGEIYMSSVWAKLFKRELIKDSKFDVEIHYGEDTIFLFENLMKEKLVYFNNEALYDYNDNAAGAMSSFEFGKRKSIISAKIKICELCQGFVDLYCHACCMLYITSVYTKVQYYKYNWCNREFLILLNDVQKRNRHYLFKTKMIPFSSKIKIFLLSKTVVAKLLAVL